MSDRKQPSAGLMEIRHKVTQVDFFQAAYRLMASYKLSYGDMGLLIATAADDLATKNGTPEDLKAFGFGVAEYIKANTEPLND